MPELPEVETIVNELKPALVNKTLSNTSILWHRTLQSAPDVFSNTIKNSMISDIHRRGKFICFSLSNNYTFTVHLRMTGKLVFTPSDKDMSHARAIFDFTDSPPLYFIDTRKFGKIKLWLPNEPLLPNLGPEPLEPNVIFRTLSNLSSIRPIKTLLMDQHILAGIGNIYADEALFKAKIRPTNPLSTISKQKLKNLSHFIPEILLDAIDKKGSTISDYRTSSQEQGQFQATFQVYGRQNLPCPTCNTPISRTVINTRSSHFCPKCQK
jgi:formamidopyrimidine-DNA glycosylase